MKTNKDLEARIAALEQRAYGKQELYTDKTGKMWSPIAENAMTWDEAVKYAEDLEAGGCRDWRLPTADELLALQKEIEGIGFYWSSTESGTDAYTVRSDNGNVCTYTKTCYDSYVRCVRG